MTVLACSACGRTLTKACAWGGEHDYDRECGMRMPAVPAGVLVRLEEADEVPVYAAEGQVDTKVYSPAGAIAMNPDDILPDILEPVGPDNGCCGSDGLDGPNRACSCNAVLATQWSDCWTQAEIRFLPDAVTVSD